MAAKTAETNTENQEKKVEEGLATSTTESVAWVTGWRLVLIALGWVLAQVLTSRLKLTVSRTGLALFIVQTESSVTSTAIISITNDLGRFQSSSWVFTAYLLTYGGE